MPILQKMRRSSLIYFCLGSLVTTIIISIPKWFNNVNRNLNSNGFTSQKRLAVVFGDSISQHGFNPSNSGWVASLSHLWSRKVDVLNRGFSGYNSRWGLAIIDDVVISLRPNVIIIFFGANDAVVAEGSTYVPLEEYKLNIERMVLRIRKTLPLCKIILITPPPVGEDELRKANVIKGKKIPLDRTNARTKTYADACATLGSKLKVAVLNAWIALEGPHPTRDLYLSDGLHLNSLGNEKLFKQFQDLLARDLPMWLPDNLPLHKEDWAHLASNQAATVSHRT